MIESSGLNPAALCFELTESAAIGNLNRAEVLMRAAAQARLQHRAG